MFQDQVKGEVIDSKVVHDGDVQNPITTLEITYQEPTPEPIKVKYTKSQIEQIIQQQINIRQSFLDKVTDCDNEISKYEDLLKKLNS